MRDLPDILFLSVDTMRRDCLAPYGRDLMPNASRLLQEGVAFEKCFASAPWTGGSFGSVFTGLWQHQHGCQIHAPRRGQPYDVCTGLRRDVPLLWERLRQAGYHALSIQGNSQCLFQGFGFPRGLDGVRPACLDPAYGRWRRELRAAVASARFRSFGRYLRFTAWRAMRRVGLCRSPRRPHLEDGKFLVGQADRCLRATPEDKPVFLWINFMDLHDPYGAPRRYRAVTPPDGKLRAVHAFPERYVQPTLTEADKIFIRDLYDSGARYVDDCIGWLLGLWTRRRRGRSRLTVLTSDHGEEFWDHGDDRADPIGYRRGVGHGHTLYNELLHVPLAVHWPRAGIPPRRSDRLASLADVTPTILDLLGLPKDSADAAGQSLAGHITSSSPRGDGGAAVFAESLLIGPQRQAAISATHKLIHCEETGETELYAWGDGDEGEKTNLAGRPAVAAVQRDLSAALDAWRSSTRTPGHDVATTERETEALLRRLKDMGYL